MEVKERILSFAQEKLESWREVPEDSVTITLSNGTSNKVYFVETSHPIIPQTIIYRQFGPDVVTDKERERKIYQKLSDEGIGPYNYGNNKAERLEEFLIGFAPISKERFLDKHVIDMVMKELKVFHSISAAEVIPREELICIANPKKWRALSLSRVSSTPDLILEECREQVDDLLNNEEYLQRYLELLPVDSPIVFSHMDASPLNFLTNETQAKFVDYEFAGFSPRSVDIASLLSEIIHDYTYEEHPYWKFYPELIASDDIIAYYVQQYGGAADMWVEVKRTRVAIDYLWALWALSMYVGDREGFDYLAYSMKRFSDFKSGYQKYVDDGGLEFLVNESSKYF